MVEEARRSRALLLKISRGSVEAGTSTLTWDEIVWVVRKISGASPSIEQGKRLLELPHLEFLGFKKNVLFRAQELMEKYKIKPRDSIHAATALENGITEIVSYDLDFDEVKEVKRLEPP